MKFSRNLAAVEFRYIKVDIILLFLAFLVVWAVAAEDYDLSTQLTNSEGFIMTSGGNAVSAAGDINKDGFDDLILGASGAFSNAGMIYIVFGKGGAGISNFDLITYQTGITTGFRIFGASAGDNFGFSVSKAGDVNGDRVDDVIVGARWADPTVPNANAGISYVFFGRKVTSAANAFTDFQLPVGTLPATVGFRILGVVADDNSGYSVSNAGDVTTTRQIIFL